MLGFWVTGSVPSRKVWTFGIAATEASRAGRCFPSLLILEHSSIAPPESPILPWLMQKMYHLMSSQYMPDVLHVIWSKLYNHSAKCYLSPQPLPIKQMIKLKQSSLPEVTEFGFQLSANIHAGVFPSTHIPFEVVTGLLRDIMSCHSFKLNF